MDTLFNPDKKILWRMANAILLTGICLSCAGRFLRIPTLAPVHVLTSLAVVLVLTFLSSMTARGRLLVLTGTLLLIFGAMSAVGLKNCVSFFLSYFHWLGGAPLPAGQSAAGFELIQAILSALSCYLLQILMEKDFRLKTAELAVLISILLYCLFARKALSRISVALILCQGAFILSEWTQLRWKKEKSGSLSAYMLWLIPFLGIYFLLMLLPAAPDEPYDWQIVKNAYRQIRESFLKFSYNFSGFGGDDYDLTLSGFSARGELSGESVETSREIMTVKSAKRLAANLYLTGKAYDSFDGKEWTAANTAPSNSHYLDTIETLHTLERYDGDYLSDYLYQADITINYRYFRSEFLFAPLKTLSLKEFPALAECSYTLKSVPKSLELSLSPAFYLVSPMDDYQDNVIFINENPRFVSQELYNTLAHEGYPGHLYQNVYFHIHCNSDIRKLLSFRGYSEGWATYVEHLSYGLDNGLKPEMSELLAANSLASLGLHACLDVYINYMGWDKEQVREYLLDYYEDPGTLTDALYNAMIENPSNYLSYYVGCMEFMNMRETAEKELKSKFDPKAFHTFLLDIGDAPFDVIQAYFTTWLKEQKS